MKNTELIDIANSIFKANNYKGNFQIISNVNQDYVNKLDLYYLGESPDKNHRVEVYYTMSSIPTNFVKHEGKFYLLF